MNKVYIFLGVVLAIVIYFLTKKKSSVVGITGDNGQSAFGSVSDYVKNILNENSTTVDITVPDNSNSSSPPLIVMGASEPISIRYYYQVIYLKWNGFSAPSGAIGFFSDGSILYYSQVELKNGMYVDRQIIGTEPIAGGNEV